MKKIRNSLLTVLFAFFMMLSLCPAHVFALDPKVEDGVTGVTQGGDNNTFTNDMPFATYRVYPSYLKIGGQYQGDSFKSNYASVTFKNEYFYNAVGSELNTVGPAVVYTGKINQGKSVTLTGEVFSFVFSGAAIDASGTTHDVKLTFKDITINNYAQNKKAQTVSLTAGSISAIAMMYDTDFSSSLNQTAEQVSAHVLPCGVSMTIQMEILGATIPGGLNVTFRDIDTPDRQSGNFDIGNYSERVEVLSNSAISNYYITRKDGTPHNLLRVSKTANGTLFRATVSDDGTFYSGFAVQLKPTNTIKWSGGYCGTSLYGGTSTIGFRPLTKLYDNTNSKIASTWTVSAAGGNIKMSDSNTTLNYVDETILYGGNNKYVARFYANTKPVTFNVKANEGYELVGMNYTTGASTDPTSNPVSLVKGNWTHTLEGGNGAHYANVFYQPIVKTLKVHKQDQFGNPVEGITFTASGTSSVHGDFSITATTNGDGNAIFEGIPYGTNTDDYTLTEEETENYEPISDNPLTFHFSDLKGTNDPDIVFENERLYTVTYVVNPDETWGTPEGGDVAPTDENSPYEYESDVTVLDPLSSSQKYAIDPTTGDEVPGTWEFGPWDKDDFQITEDTTINGTWTFTPDTYTVTYNVKPDAKWGSPLFGDIPPVDEHGPYDYKDPVTVLPVLKSMQDYAIDPVTGKKIPGTWTFSGWDHEDFEITENTTIKGSWEFTPDTYEVTYKVNPDETWGTPIGKDVAPTDENNPYDYKDDVTVLPVLTSDQEYAIDPNTGDEVPGTWTFGPWNKEDFQIVEDTTISGTWTFTPTTYDVTYTVGEDENWGKPEDSVVPVDENNPYDFKDDVTVLPVLTSDQKYAIDPNTGDEVPGEWTFGPWDKDDFQIEEDIEITGSWTFIPDTYEVTYTVNEDETWGTPEGGDVAPVDENNPYDFKEDVTVLPELTTDQDYAIDPNTGDEIPGTWTFGPWNKEDFQITEDTEISGTWTFTPKTYTVTYNVTADGVWGMPVGGAAPTDENNPYDYKENVTVLPDLTTTQKYALDPETGERVPGSWEFVSWDTEDFQITEDTEINGSWIFTPDTYTVTYEVKPDEKWGAPTGGDVVPTDGNNPYDYKDPVTVVPVLTSTQDYALDAKGNKVPGKWTFGPWNKGNFNITADTTISGYWKFTPKPVVPDTSVR